MQSVSMSSLEKHKLVGHSVGQVCDADASRVRFAQM